MSYYDHHNQTFSDLNYDDDFDAGDVSHKKDVRRKLEMRLERKRLKEELEDYEGELDDDFDWSDLE